MKFDTAYWQQRYRDKQTGWDIGFASPPLTHYFDQLQDPTTTILIPGCGNAYEAEYLFNLGFKNVYVVDMVASVLANFQKRVPQFPSKNLIINDLFTLKGQFDLIVEQTFFCALSPHKREQYCEKMENLLAPGGKLVGVLFERDFEHPGPPFGGNIKEYQSLFTNFFKINTLANCYNSIEPRQNTELFFIFEKK
ncbi:methyltransferase domain-containing protein [Aquimarina sp. U1-2]|uniref:methyltransferase domain-containing protein n=1 Tax=Aquimarina sp. U1-2 TaxID=2823141 RepID=UPI001AED071B|nr:methyltransferase domain-containing protein [Aquimarina sp. U1-2]MBP2832318.1 methyltransferase domain-containing protein [Aquimarina sp. U1-2]